MDAKIVAGAMPQMAANGYLPVLAAEARFISICLATVMPVGPVDAATSGTQSHKT